MEELDELIKKSSSLSASKKIAEMGLGRTTSHEIPKSSSKLAQQQAASSEEKDLHSDFKRILSETSAAQVNNYDDEDSDSDDLF